MIILGLDLETTGLDTDDDRIVEIGAVQYDTDSSAPVTIYSAFVKSDKLIPQDVSDSTGITNAMVERYGLAVEDALSYVHFLISDSHVTMAHNGIAFDYPMLRKSLARVSLEMPESVFIDTMFDLPYPSKIKTRNLTHLAAEHGIINPFPHRAVFDVFTMFAISKNYDMTKVVEIAKQPLVTLVAHVSYNDRNLASNRGFKWQPETKRWIKTLREEAANAESRSIEEFKTSIAAV